MREAFLFLIIAVVFVAALMGAGDANIARLDVAATTALHVIGGVIAGAMTFALVIASLTGVTGRRQTRLLIPLLAGLALGGWHWSASIALAAVGVGLLVTDRFYPPSESEAAANAADEES